MAAITYGTRYSNAAGDPDGLPLKLLWHETRYNTGSWANHVYVQLTGRNTEFKVGQKVTVETPTDTFSGEIWYIYNSSSVYNIYIHPSTKKASEIKDATTGLVWFGSVAHPAVTGNGTNAAEAGKSVIQSEVEAEAKGEALADSKGMGVLGTDNPNKKYIIIAGVVLLAIAGILIYRKLKK
jgi:hypothetical protein